MCTKPHKGLCSHIWVLSSLCRHRKGPRHKLPVQFCTVLCSSSSSSRDSRCEPTPSRSTCKLVHHACCVGLGTCACCRLGMGARLFALLQACQSPNPVSRLKPPHIRRRLHHEVLPAAFRRSYARLPACLRSNARTRLSTWRFPKARAVKSVVP